MKKIYNIILIVLIIVLISRIINPLELFTVFDPLHCESTESNIKQDIVCMRKRSSVSKQANAKKILENVSSKLEKLIEYIATNYPYHHITRKILKKYKYNVNEASKHSKFTAYSENKGEKLAFCLYSDKISKTFIDENTLTFVSLHELGHVGTEGIGHHPQFWKNFRWLLERAIEIKIYTPVNYRLEPKNYCGMVISDNPYFDMPLSE